MTKVWQRMKANGRNGFADWIDLTMQTIFSGYRRRYLEYLVYQHRTFDVKGLSTQGPYSLELDRVYVQLGVDPTTIAWSKLQSSAKSSRKTAFWQPYDMAICKRQECARAQLCHLRRAW